MKKRTRKKKADVISIFSIEMSPEVGADDNAPAPATSTEPHSCIACDLAGAIWEEAKDRQMTSAQAGSACATVMVRICMTSPVPEAALEMFVSLMKKMMAEGEIAEHETSGTAESREKPAVH